MAHLNQVLENVNFSEMKHTLTLHNSLGRLFDLWKVPPKQTVPVAPRTRTTPDEALLDMMNTQSRPSRVDTQIQEDEPKEQAPGRVPGNAEDATLSPYKRKHFSLRACARLNNSSGLVDFCSTACSVLLTG